jgi:transcriptional regulator of acetoin/glycerol metabolism
MGVTRTPQRQVIAMSWRRATLSGLDPGAPVDNLAVEDVDRRSRLLVAAEPVLDEVAEDIEGTGYSLILADRQARLVDIRTGKAALRGRMENIGVRHGSRFAEDATGTNSIATTFEVRRGLAVRGEEHFIETYKKFSCYGHPVVHPATRRVEGVLDITCLSEHDSPLLAPFLVRAARQIAERLVAGARERDRRLLEVFQNSRLRERSRPVVAIGEDAFLANEAAIELLDPEDHAVLRGLAVEAPVDREVSRHLVLTAGSHVRATIRRLPGAGGGTVVAFETVEPVTQASVVPMRGTAPVLIHGESGSGRTTALRELVRPEPVAVLDAGELPAIGEQAWLSRLNSILARSPVVGVEAVDLLPDPVARRCAVALRHARARLVLTSAPAGELRGEVAGLVAHCVERVELTPLRQRRNDIPGLVQSMLKRLDAPRELRFTPSALEALASQPWPGNLRELFSVVRQVVRTRRVGDVTVRDLPPSYQSRARAGRLTPLQQAEHGAIVEALRACGGVKKSAAKQLGISRSTLYAAIRTLGIVDPC